MSEATDQPHPVPRRDLSSVTTSWQLAATPAAVPALRGEVRRHLDGAGVPAATTADICLAVSEAVTNVVRHAYPPDATEPVQLILRCGRRPLGAFEIVVEVIDAGRGVEAGQDAGGMGQGLAMIGALAEAVSITSRPDGRGTQLIMTFGDRSAAAGGCEGLEDLCAVALDQIADVSCVDRIQDGVLRRVATDVRGDPDLADWLREALPPTRPGTATWAALREGELRLVVHDPSLPRPPGGTGERLGLQWWIAIPQGSGGPAPFIWGLGGRAGGRPVPDEATVALLARACHEDLADASARTRLRDALRSGAPSALGGAHSAGSAGENEVTGDARGGLT